MKTIVGLVFAAVMAVSAAGCAAANPYAAKVNDGVVSERELDAELDAILGNKAYLTSLEQDQVKVRGTGEGTVDMAFAARVLTRQIYFELVNQELRRRKVKVTQGHRRDAEREVVDAFPDKKAYDAFPQSYKTSLVARTAEITALQEALAGVPVDDKAIAAFYADNSTLFNETCVSHILVDAKPTADQLATRLAAGEDFAAIARADSKDPGSGPQGGELGCVGPGNFVAEFETAMDAMPPGAVSSPVQTEFGWHLIKVKERRVRPLNEAREDIRQRLLGDSQGNLNEFLSESVSSAKIEVNPRYGRFVRDGQQPGIVPPQAPRAARGNDQIPGFDLPGQPQPSG